MLKVVSSGFQSLATADSAVTRLQQALVKAGQNVVVDGISKAADNIALLAVLAPMTQTEINTKSIDELIALVEAKARWPLWAKLLVAGGVAFGVWWLVRWFSARAE